MITIQEQEKLFIEIGKTLDKKIECFAIGGTAMMFLGLKDSTKDIDLVFLNKEDRKMWKKVAISLGYKEIEARSIYGRRDNLPDVIFIGDWRIDLFLNEIISFSFLKSAQERIIETHEFSDNLIIKIANPNDIFLMKCATDRIKDLDDGKVIIDKNLVNWDVLIKETLNQIASGHELAAISLGYFLEKLEKVGAKISHRALDDLFSIVEKQAEYKRSKLKNKD